MSQPLPVRLAPALSALGGTATEPAPSDPALSVPPVPCGEFRAACRPAREGVAKVLFDFGLSAVLIVLALPVLLVIAALVKLTSRGPFLYRQTRVGRGGRPYTIYKVRSMSVNSEKDGACWSQPGDPRVTRVGRVLRDAHLDELPQLWNVLRGDMSLIGPRPERPEFVPGLAAVIPNYGDRLLVRPGVTGLAQVQQAADSSLASVRQKLAYDLWYVQNRTFGLDLRILVGTGLKLCGVPFPTLRWVCGFPTPEEAEQDYLALTGGTATPAAQTVEVCTREDGGVVTPVFGAPFLLNAPERA